MIRNYWKTALRFMQKNKTFSFINILGLATGTLCCLYILLYSANQYSYDKHHLHAADIYRIDTELGMKQSGKTTLMASSSPPFTPAMKKDFSVVQQYTRVVPTVKFGVIQHLLRYRERSTYETDAIFADSTFFDMFSYHFTHGSPARALAEPYSVVLLQSTADRLFGREDPIGRVISIDNAYGKHDFKVSGVVDESLGHTHIKADLFMAMNSGGLGSYVRGDDRWAGDNMIAAYVRLTPGADPAALERQLPAFLDKYAADQFKEGGMTKGIAPPAGRYHPHYGRSRI